MFLGGRARTFQGKESLAIDLKSEEGRAAVQRLVAQADAVMHNMRGDAAARLGIDYETARETESSPCLPVRRLVRVDRARAGRAAFHPMMGALSGGALRQLGRGNEPPAADVPMDAEARYELSLRMLRSNEASPDITGALGVATALSLGLLHRERTGQGQYIETTMLASNLLLCSEDAIRYAGQPDLPELDSDLRGTSALNRLYRTADGWLFLSTPTEPEWRHLCAAVGHAEWAGDPRYRTAATRRRFNDQLLAELATALESSRPPNGRSGSPGPVSRASAPTRAAGMTSSCPMRKASATASWCATATPGCPATAGPERPACCLLPRVWPRSPICSARTGRTSSPNWASAGRRSRP